MFGVLFTLPNLHSLTTWRLENILFVLFWGILVIAAASYGLCEELGQQLLADKVTLQEWGEWLWKHTDWLLRICLFCLSFGLIGGILSWLRPKLFNTIVGAIPALWKGLRSVLVICHTRDNDGESILLEDKVDDKKEKTRTLGVPKAIRLRQQHAMKSVDERAIMNGSIAMKK